MKKLTKTQLKLIEEMQPMPAPDRLQHVWRQPKSRQLQAWGIAYCLYAECKPAHALHYAEWLAKALDLPNPRPKFGCVNVLRRNGELWAGATNGHVLHAEIIRNVDIEPGAYALFQGNLFPVPYIELLDWSVVVPTGTPDAHARFEGITYPLTMATADNVCIYHRDDVVRTQVLPMDNHAAVSLKQLTTALEGMAWADASVHKNSTVLENEEQIAVLAHCHPPR